MVPRRIDEAEWSAAPEMSADGESTWRENAEPIATLNSRVVRPALPGLVFVSTLLCLTAYFIQPGLWISAISTVPFAKIFAAIGLAGSLLMLPVTVSKIAAVTRSLPQVRALIAMFVWLVLGIPFAMWRGGSLDYVITFIWKVVAVIVLMLVCADSFSRMRKLLKVEALSFLLICGLGLRAVQHGYVFRALEENQRQFFINPNEVALKAALAVPLCVAFLMISRSVLPKIFWISAAIVCCVTIVLTESRGGVLALSAGMLVLMFRGTLRGKRALLAGLIIAIVLVLFLSAPANFSHRLGTVLSPDEDVTGSAQARQELLTQSLLVTLHHPIFGVGIGNFDIVSGSWHQTHNTYTQISSELGLPALLFFLYALFHSWKSIRKVERSVNNKEYLVIASGLKAMLVTAVVGLFFYSAGYELLTLLPITYSVLLIKASEAEMPVENVETGVNTARVDNFGGALQP